jgi:hypothetical protein
MKRVVEGILFHVVNSMGLVDDKALISGFQRVEANMI